MGDDVFDMKTSQKTTKKKVDNHIQKYGLRGIRKKLDSYGNVDSYIIPNFRFVLIMHNRPDWWSSLLNGCISEPYVEPEVDSRTYNIARVL